MGGAQGCICFLRLNRNNFQPTENVFYDFQEGENVISISKPEDSEIKILLTRDPNRFVNNCRETGVYKTGTIRSDTIHQQCVLNKKLK